MVHLYAAVVPPEQVRRGLASVVDAVRLAPEAGPPGRRRGLGLRKRREAGADQAGASGEGMLTAVPVSDLEVQFAGFGNVSKTDMPRLLDALAEAAAQWPSPRLRISGGVALDWPGDDGVWARIDGDLDELGEIARGIPQVAQRLRFYVDRRRFRPLIRLGAITDTTTAPYLETLLADLSTFQSAWWEQRTLPVWELSASTDGPRLKLHTEIPLGSG